MATIGIIKIGMSVNLGGLNRDMRMASRVVEDFRDRTGSALGSAISSFTNLGLAVMGAQAIISGLGRLVGPLKLAADAEQTAVAFRVMLGSASEATKVIADLNKFAADTPFQFPELTGASKQLLAFGFQSQDLIPTLTKLGDLSAALNIPIGEMAYLYGTTRVQGRLFAQDLNQFVGRGIPLIQELAKQFKVSESEVKKLVEQGKVGFPQVEQAITKLTTGTGKFAGLMSEQSKTLGGVWSSFTDNINLMMTDVGFAIVKAFDLTDVISQTSSFVQQWKSDYIPVIQLAFEWLAATVRTVYEWGKVLKWVVPIIGGVITVMMAITVAQKAIAAGQAIVLALSGPGGWAILAAGAAIGVAAVATVNHQMNKLKKETMAAKAETDKAGVSMRAMGATASTAAVQVNELVVSSGGMSAGWKKAVEEMQKVAREIRKFKGVTDDQLMFEEMIAGGAHPKIMRNLLKLKQMRAVYEADKKLAEAARDVYSDTQPLVAYSQKVAELQAMFRRGMIGPETLAKAIRQTKEEALGIDSTPLAKYQDRMRELQDMLRSGAINKTEFKAGALAALPDEVKRIIEATESPLDKFRKRVAEIMEFRKAGLINDKVKDLAIDAAREDIFGKAKLELASSAELGSKEAADAIARHRFGYKDHMKNLEKNSKEHLAVSKESLAIARRRKQQQQPAILILP